MRFVYIHWIGVNPNIIICSFRAFTQLGGEFMGLPLCPDSNCSDDRLYGIDDYTLTIDSPAPPSA